MEWMPKWIGRLYSKFWAKFKEDTFYFNDAEKLAGKLTSNYLSEIKKAQALFIFEREGRKRVYRLVPPNLYAYSLSNKIDLGWLKQGSYANLILKILFILKEKFGQDLLSLGVYGSVARNNAKKESDLDIFLICRGFSVNLGDRLDFLIELEKMKIIQDELYFLNNKRFYPRISFYPRLVSELTMSFFTIDIAFDIKIIYDDTNVLKRFLSNINKRIREQGIRRIYLDKERYYLDLNIKFGEIFEFE
ncbi:MAG: nucleotidyltransferase domain-containing protein [Candidatus Lokiarchaeota archaeon]|nr:nucleotidyltransferase domain-containing protein [Candidatus Lokiarchaeota archaeon]